RRQLAFIDVFINVRATHILGRKKDFPPRCLGTVWLRQRSPICHRGKYPERLRNTSGWWYVVAGGVVEVPVNLTRSPLSGTVEGRLPTLPVEGRAPTLPVAGRVPTFPVVGRVPIFPVEGLAPLEPQPRASRVFGLAPLCCIRF